jgi:hypothetical protein
VSTECLLHATRQSLALEGEPELVLAPAGSLSGVEEMVHLSLSLISNVIL